VKASKNDVKEKLTKMRTLRSLPSCSCYCVIRWYICHKNCKTPDQPSAGSLIDDFHNENQSSASKLLNPQERSRDWLIHSSWEKGRKAAGNNSSRSSTTQTMSVDTGRETGYIERGGRTGRIRFCTAPTVVVQVIKVWDRTEGDLFLGNISFFGSVECILKGHHFSSWL